MIRGQRLLAIDYRHHREALSHQPFLLLITWPFVRPGFNKFNGLANRQCAARDPFLARCDGVDGARAASGSMKGRAKMVVV
jgi:hypothetical protein